LKIMIMIIIEETAINVGEDIDGATLAVRVSSYFDRRFSLVALSLSCLRTTTMK
jgi:hypothetical protein